MPLREKSASRPTQTLQFFTHDESVHPRALGRVTSDAVASVVEHADAGVLVLGEDLRIRSINPVAQPIFASLGNVVGMPWTDVLRAHWPEDTVEDVMHLARRTLRTGAPHSSLDFAGLRVDLKREEHYHWDIHRVTCADGEIIVVCYFAGPLTATG